MKKVVFFAALLFVLFLFKNQSRPIAIGEPESVEKKEVTTSNSTSSMGKIVDKNQLTRTNEPRVLLDHAIKTDVAPLSVEKNSQTVNEAAVVAPSEKGIETQVTPNFRTVTFKSARTAGLKMGADFPQDLQMVIVKIPDGQTKVPFSDLHLENCGVLSASHFPANLKINQQGQIIDLLSSDRFSIETLSSCRVLGGPNTDYFTLYPGTQGSFAIQ